MKYADAVAYVKSQPMYKDWHEAKYMRFATAKQIDKMVAEGVLERESFYHQQWNWDSPRAEVYYRITNQER